MKKILAMLLTIAMLLSLVIVATVNVAAAEENEGMWTVMGNAQQYDENYFDDKKDVPGYEYTNDGFSTVTPAWATSTPFATIQSKAKVNLKTGVYFEVRIDAYSYDASDSWFNFNIWDSVNLDPGNGDDTYGNGVQTLLRPAKTGPAEKDGAIVGSVSSIAWYTEAFTHSGGTTIEAANKTTVDVEGVAKDVFALAISWENNSYVVTINGSAAPDKVITYMNEKFADGEAYIGFTMHNSTKGGTAAATVTKFGTSKATATVPYGTDYAAKEEFDNSFAATMDPATVPAGTPAILMNGSRDTDLKNTPSSSTGTTIVVTDENTIKVTANGSTADFGTLKVDNSKTADVKDFPVLLCVTKNWCSCKMEAHEDCLALESMGAYVLIGDDLAPAPGNKVGELDMCYDPVIIGEDNYLYFWVDLSELDKEGRFNGVRFDAAGCDLVNDGFNTFEMLWTGLFRDVEEAETYVLAYLEAIENGGEFTPPEGDTETTAPSADNTDTTVDASEDTTEEVVGTTVDTEATQATEAATTEEKTEATTVEATQAATEATQATTAETKAPAVETTEAAADDAATTEEGGCGSFVGFGAMAVVAVAAVAGMVSFKKKED